MIFHRYAELGSVRLLGHELDRLGVVSKRREGAGGVLAGGNRFSRGALYTLLQNPIYRGEIGHLTLDELSERLNPRTQAQNAVDEAKIALDELKRKVTGQVRPADEPEPTRLGWIVLGSAAALSAAVVGAVIRKL